MLQTLLLAFLLAQDPKPAAKTVEDRLKELADKLETLDKKAAALADENAKLQQKVDEARTRREGMARQSGTIWVKRYAAAAQFTPKQSTDIEELWFGWTLQDVEKGAAAAPWKEREQTLRGKLTPEQVPLLAGKVREEQELSLKTQLTTLAQFGKVNQEKVAALEKAVRPKLAYDEGILLPQAHPDRCYSWTQVLEGVEASLADLSPALTDGEVESLRKIVGQWKPKSR